MKIKNLSLLLGTLLFVTSYAGAQTQTPVLNDAEIAGVVATLNAGEINEGNLAVSSAQSNTVKTFAQQLVTDHTNANKSLTDLLAKLGMSTAPSDLSTKLEKDSADSVNTMKSAKAAEFDKVFIDAEVKGHQAALDLFDNTLIPQVQNADLKTELTKDREVVNVHLIAAKAIQATMSTPAPSNGSDDADDGDDSDN